LTVLCSETRPNAKPENVTTHTEKPAAQPSTFVFFAETQAYSKKPKELPFSNATIWIVQIKSLILLLIVNKQNKNE